MKVNFLSKGYGGVVIFLVLLALNHPSAQAQALFDLPQNFKSGDGILSMVSADFNKDGLLDFATSNKKTDTVSVHLNQGGGTFADPWAEYHVGPFAPPSPLDNNKAKSLPIGVAVADFNKDTCADLVLAISQADTVSVLLNKCDGTGRFFAPTDFTVRLDGFAPTPGNTRFLRMYNPEDVTTGDFNGDGNMDVATSNIGWGGVSVMLGDGLGHLGFPSQHFVGAEPISIIAADLNGDGKPEIVTSNNGPEIVPLLPGSPIRMPKYTVSVLRNTTLAGGATSFATEMRYEVGPNPSQVISGDMNNDGKLDLIVANHVVAGAPAPNMSWVSILLNRGTGTFDPEIQVATDQFPNAVAVADLHNDGRLDIITVQDYTPGTFSVSTQNIDGTFTAFTTFSPGVMNAPNVLHVADFDGDGDKDLLASSKNSDDFSLLLNQFVANPAPAATLPPVAGTPDLSVIISKVRADFKDGETKFGLQIDVLNAGNGSASGWFRITASLGGAVLHTWDIFDGVQAGVAPVLKYKAKLSGSVAGQMLSIVVDTDNIIAESNEANNTTTQIMD